MELRKKILPENDYLMSAIGEFWERIGIALITEKTTVNKYHFKILDKKKLAWAIIQYNLDIFS